MQKQIGEYGYSVNLDTDWQKREMLPFSLFVLKSRVTFYKIGYFNIIAHLLMCVMYLCVVFALVCTCLQNVGCPVLSLSVLFP